MPLLFSVIVRISRLRFSKELIPRTQQSHCPGERIAVFRAKHRHSFARYEAINRWCSTGLVTRLFGVVPSFPFLNAHERTPCRWTNQDGDSREYHRRSAESQ